jgi:putative zinc finger/helix-turn-helix YgiT family protein
MPAPVVTKCMVCRQRAVSPTTLASYTTEMAHDGRKYPISVADFSVLQCQNCGDIYLDEAANERLSDALRDAAGLLSPAEIQEKREGLGLTQEQLASLLRIPEYTISHWEAGAQIQQGSMDAFLRVLFQSAEARSILDSHDVEWMGTGDHLNVPAGTPAVG